MKKGKSKSLRKQAKKDVFNNLSAKLINDLSEFAAELGDDSKRIKKAIKKSSEKLAQKILKQLRLPKIQSVKQPKSVEVTAPVKAGVKRSAQPDQSMADAVMVTKPAISANRIPVTSNPTTKAARNGKSSKTILEQ